MASTVVKFTKMHGAGNDYIYVNTLLYEIPDPAAAAVEWSDRHKGIGGDGLVLIGRPADSAADFSMRIFNADGSEAMMCGNASRCIGKYLYDKGLTDKTTIRLDTLSGVKTLGLRVAQGKVESVTVDMLEPVSTCRHNTCPASAMMAPAVFLQAARCSRARSSPWAIRISSYSWTMFPTSM